MKKGIATAFEIRNHKVCSRGLKVRRGVFTRGYGHGSKSCFAARIDIARRIADHEHVARIERSSGVTRAFLRGSSDEFGSTLCIGTKAAELEKSVQVSAFELDPCAALDVAGREAECEVWIRVEILKEGDDSRQNCVVGGLLYFFRKKAYIDFQYFFHRGGLMGIAISGKDLADNGRISFSPQPDTIQGVDNANNLTECPIEGTNARTTGCNQGPVDVEEQQLHAAILREDEFYFRL